MSNNIAQLVIQAKNDANFNAIIDQVPYAKLIGLAMSSIDDQLVISLPFKPENIGNSALPALHGGVIGGFLESAALLHLIWISESAEIPLTINFSIDYLRPAKAEMLYAKCNITKQGRRIVNMEVTTWQSNFNEPVAIARVHFLLRTNS